MEKVRGSMKEEKSELDAERLEIKGIMKENRKREIKVRHVIKEKRDR